MAYYGTQDGIRNVGILLHEGVTKIQVPAIQVLEMSSTSSSRKSDDLLPYLPDLRKNFAPLPHKKSELSIKAAVIPLSDVECITQTMFKVGRPAMTLVAVNSTDQVQLDPSDLLAHDRDLPQQAQDELLDLCSEWTSSIWDEQDFSRVKDMTVREILDNRKVAAAAAQDARSVSCPHFVKHVSLLGGTLILSNTRQC